jgi:hypothetical protein
LVNESGPASILTPSKKRIKNIAIFLKVCLLVLFLKPVFNFAPEGSFLKLALA